MYPTQGQENQKNRLYAAAATFLYVAALVLLLLLVHIRQDRPDDLMEGILVNFGSTETGSGEIDPAASDETADAAHSTQSSSAETPEDVLTQETEAAPAVTVNPRTQQRPTPAQPTQPTNRPVEEQPVEQPRQVNQQAMFPGRTPGSSSTSEGTADGQGNQGNPAGDPAGSHDGTGTGDSGIAYSLTGRSIIGSLPKPDYTAKEEGRVVIEIYVDQQGKVTRTAYRSVGSTTSNATLVAAARAAALKAKFNDLGENGTQSQTGTITYNFKMQ